MAAPYSGDSASSTTRKAERKAREAKNALMEYLPPVGVVGAGIFAANLMSPLVLTRPLGVSRSLAGQNICFALAHIGTGVYIYDKMPLKEVIGQPQAALLAATGAMLFNYGSTLALANVKHYLPQNDGARVVIGLGVLGYLFYAGRAYLLHNERASLV